MLIRATTLSRLLDRPKHFIGRLGEDKKPPVILIGGVQHFDIAAADEWLASLPRTPGFTTEVTVADLRSGVVKLVRTAEAGAIVFPDAPQESHVWRIDDLCNRGHLEHMMIGGLRHFDIAYLVAFAVARERARHHFPYGRLKHLIGAPQTTIYRAVERGDLSRTKVDGRFRITRQSLLRLLTTMLPSVNGRLVIKPQEWVERRELSERPLLETPVAAARLALNRETFPPLLSSGRIIYIRTLGGGKALVMPESVDRYMLSVPTLSVAEKAAVYGVEQEVYWSWVRAGLFNCPIHRHPMPGDMYRWCLVEYLRSRCGPGVDPLEWVNRTLNQGFLVWMEPWIAARLKQPVEEVRSKLEAARVPYALSPAGQRVYRAGQVKIAYGKSNRNRWLDEVG